MTHPHHLFVLGRVFQAELFHNIVKITFDNPVSMAVLVFILSKTNFENTLLTKAQAQKGTHQLHGLSQRTNNTSTKI